MILSSWYFVNWNSGRYKPAPGLQSKCRYCIHFQFIGLPHLFYQSFSKGLWLVRLIRH